jgi:hypothetical protein
VWNKTGIKYWQRVTYKQVVYMINAAGGFWSTDVLHLVQEDLESLQNNVEFRGDVLCSLVGLKLLHQEFTKDKKMWRMIDLKVRRYLATEGVEDVDATL